VTAYPTAEWIARQVAEAFPWNEVPRYLIRDRDGTYCVAVTRRLRAKGIRDKPIAADSPWQNSFAERLIGTIRRECVDHIVVLGETHLRRTLREYARYYNTARTHRSLDQDAPVSRSVQQIGRIMSHALVGGLHHQYVRSRFSARTPRQPGAPSRNYGVSSAQSIRANPARAFVASNIRWLKFFAKSGKPRFTRLLDSFETRWHRLHRPCKGRARHLGCAARDLDQKSDRGCLGAEEGLHTRATLPTDRCHFNHAAVHVNRDHRDDAAFGEEDIVE
jgi:hypothetical protein